MKYILMGVIIGQLIMLNIVSINNGKADAKFRNKTLKQYEIRANNKIKAIQDAMDMQMGKYYGK